MPPYTYHASNYKYSTIKVTKFLNNYGRYDSGELDVDVKIILRLLLKKKDVVWIQLARNMAQWSAFVNTKMNLLIPYKAGNFLTS
jgi:hypothetical protein